MTLPDLRDQLRYAYDPQIRGLHRLMARRVRTILMVSNPYESFSISRDYSLSQDIYGASLILHLQNVPQVVSALSAREGLEMIAKENFDLVLVSGNLPDMDTPAFGRQVKTLRPGLPVALLLFDWSWTAQSRQVGAGTSGIDWVFAWRGTADVLLSIIKLVEDSFNVDRDIAIASIGTILVIEDAIEHYSLILPQLYSMLMQRTFKLAPEGINESERQVRTRVRPKVLLARTFGEAERLFAKYENSLLGVISDLHTLEDDRVNPETGPLFLRSVVNRAPGIPILVHSSEPNVEEIAGALGARALSKRGVNMRAGIEQFVLVDIGFGDFYFRRPDGSPIGSASNMWEMEHTLRTVPAESFVYHANRNDLSRWFRARGELALAATIQPLKLTDFPSIDELRQYVIDAISIARREKYRGAVADFRPPEFDSEYPFLVMGRGSLGGKGRGLAFVFKQLSQWAKDDRLAGAKVRLPRTLVIGADESTTFLRQNDMDVASLDGLSDDEVRKWFAEAELDGWLRDALDFYVKHVQVPLAVRSSGLLEDSHRQPSAGLYATYMLPNNDPDPKVRLEQLMTAIKLVYGSAFLERPRRYLEAIGQDLNEAKMAAIVQEVVGRQYGRYYYPAISGVAQSYNFYPVFQMKPDDGVATIALGLGKQVVEGGEAVRFCPRHPQVLPQFRSPGEVMKVAQREFFALDLESSAIDLLQGTDATLARLPLREAEAHGTLAVAGSVVDTVEDRIFDGIHRRGSRVVTFARVLKHNVFPLSGILNELFESFRKDLGFPVEIEFAVNIDEDESNEPEFFFLQMRPLVANRERCEVDPSTVRPEKLVCHSRRVLGNGSLVGVRDIVYVDPAHFDRGQSTAVASVIAEVNERLAREGRGYVLIGPGRWGSFDPWIGIPVAWHQISAARAIVEVPAADLPIEPSQGTHFFHNMTSAGIGYFSLSGNGEDEFVRWDLLNALPGEKRPPGVRHVRLRQPLSIRMDGLTQRGLIALP